MLGHFSLTDETLMVDFMKRERDLLKNLGYYVLFFFILNIVVNSLSRGEPSLIASILTLVLLSFWLLVVKLQKREK